MCAIIEDHDFAIDSYLGWTKDWGKTPDGHYYSNKAPGPSLLAIPIFWMIDRVFDDGETRLERDNWRFRNRGAILKLLSITFQVIPFSTLAMFVLTWLEDNCISIVGRHFAMLAMLFGNTAAIFMDTFFGHGLAAACLIGAVMSLFTRRFILSGFLFGFAVLSDYGVGLIAFPFLTILGSRPRVLPVSRIFLRFLSGTILPVALWCGYHISCFGSPFILAFKYQNPEFTDAPHYQIWGVLRFLPDFDKVIELLVGSRRGLLITQPWILFLMWLIPYWLLMPSLIEKSPWKRPIMVLSISGLLLLLWMNSSFDGWHGGQTPGPRYLSPILPLFGLVAGMVYDQTNRCVKICLWLGLCVSLTLYIVAFSTTILAPPTSALWTFYGRQVFDAAKSRELASMGILIALFSLGIYYGVLQIEWRNKLWNDLLKPAAPQSD
jgi:hypothetical protein